MENNASAILEGLNSEQKQAVSCVDGPVLIVAGAGSGKTRVLTSRIAYILEQGGDPSGILSLTFTKKAASEMKERIAMMVGERKARRLWMGTFHSVFIRFLREYSESLGYPQAFTIYDTGDSQSAIKTCLKELQLDEKVYKPKDVLSRISMAKNNLVTAESYARNSTAIQNDAAAKKPKIYEIYRLYDAKCRQAGVMDFDDILLNMNILLRDNPAALESIAGRFHHIMVDEYQDTNYSQYLILKKLASFHRNICVVGDDSQSIYAFRGAKIENILNFQKDYPDNRTFRLEQNYRSTQTIVDAANSVIARNSARIPKKCFSAGDVGEKIKIIQAYTEQEEALLIASGIIARVQSEHAQYQDFAILYRTNSQSRALEEALRRRNLPYMIYSGNSFYERMEVKDMMAYFKLAVNPNDDESFKRVVNKPARGIGDTSMAALLAAATEKGCSLMRAAFLDDLERYGLKQAAIGKIRLFAQMMAGYAAKIDSEDAHRIATGLAADSGLYMSFKSDSSIESQSRAANIEELMNGVKTFVEERHNEYFEDMQADGSLAEGAELAEGDFPVVTLSDYLENVSLLSAVDVEEGDDVNNKISMMTVHSSKGLEYPYIYVAGMEENIFPSGGMMASESEIEEERRLFYVAVTRAKKAVSLCLATTRMRNGKHESNAPSRFVREIDSQYVDNPLSANDEDDNAGYSGGFGSRPYGSARAGGHGQSRGAYGNSGGCGGTGKYGNKYGGSQYGGQRGSQYGGQRGGNPESGYSYGRSGAVKIERSAVSRTAAPKSGVTPIRRPNPAAPARVPDTSFIPTPVLELKAGMRVEHNRFGFGDLIEITGDSSGMKAKIRFDDYGEKILLLNYAKLRKVED
ncbi:MAG: UvrD-helicase domain-containing protein [Bacteroidales bacterium]|nr:UvrD-helicase domain-containing protein [Bacteroidales bacterium]